MRKARFFMKAPIISVAAILIFPLQAFAYLDPGTGSYVLQVVVGALLGGAFAVKAFWKNIRSFITDIVKTKKD